MRHRPLLLASLLIPGVLIGIWIGSGSGQGTAPARGGLRLMVAGVHGRRPTPSG